MWNDYRQRIGLSVILSGLIVVMIDYSQGQVVFPTIVLIALGVLLGLLIWWTRPGRGGPHMSQAAAQAAAGDDDVILYWRPG